MNNSWNKIIYKIWSPVYDIFFNSGAFLKAPKQVFLPSLFKDGGKVLFVGVGTGADLEFYNDSNLDITAIDFSPDMLEKAKKKFNPSSIKFIKMDAQEMDFENESFDYVVGSLILSVVPDSDQCFQEMKRVLKKEGKLIIFDKFVPKNKQLSFSKKLLRPFVKVMGTDIGINFEELFQKHKKNLSIVEDQPVMLNGMYRKIVITKTS